MKKGMKNETFRAFNLSTPHLWLKFKIRPSRH